MTPKQRAKKIMAWIKNYAKKSNAKCLVVGVSGGIDSAVVSSLCAGTGLPVIALTMPIKQNKKLHNLSLMHATWLTKHFKNVKHANVDLTPTFKQFEKLFNGDNALALANSRSRLRMMALYQTAQMAGGLVVGTGNKVEDFGVGFFTKYGDGGVDISPIGDCMKSDVWDMGREMGVLQEIIDAPPTDGLWDDGRTDEQQLGMSYAELEAAMQLDESGQAPANRVEREQLKRYREIRRCNLHKMLPIPVCTFKE